MVVSTVEAKAFKKEEEGINVRRGIKLLLEFSDCMRVAFHGIQ